MGCFRYEHIELKHMQSNELHKLNIHIYNSSNFELKTCINIVLF